MTEDYNGWTNRETWAVKLHLDNNHGDYLFMTGLAKEFVKAGHPLWKFGDELKDIAENIFHAVIYDGQASKEARMFVDDVGSLWRVDWASIARAYYEEIGSPCKVHDGVWTDINGECPVCTHTSKTDQEVS